MKYHTFANFIRFFPVGKGHGKLFASQNGGETLYVCPIVRSEKFFMTTFCARLKILPFCEKRVCFFLSGNEKNLCKNAPEILSQTLFTSVLHTDFKHRGRKK
ncbi:MAG: hypothetical protein L6V93_19490 [Clostridiales bacterium]|nr:MAG: hypothetical protein L6V93_19490 [Clostridiales bacterium]